MKSNRNYDFEINNMSEDDQINYVIRKWLNIRYIQNPSEKVQLAAIKKEIASIIYINKPTELVQIEVVNNFNFNFNYDYFIKEYITSDRAKELYKKMKKAHMVII
jgi:hypothetical protein